jgi:hypothetical protein
MPPVVPVLTAIGGGSALAGGALVAGTGLALGSAAADRNSQKKAIESAETQKEASQAFIEQSIKEARSDIFKLFPAAQDSRKQGLQAGLDLFSQAYPQMQQSFTQGNVGAQNALLAGLPQMNNAILGNPVDLSGLQAMQLPTQSINLPQVNMQGIGGLGLTGQNQPAPQQMPTPEQLAALYGGNYA